MSKWIRALALSGVFAVGAGTVASLSSPSAFAYSQKAKAKEADPKKAEEPKKDEPKKTTAAGKAAVVIKPDAKGRYRLSVRNEDGKTLLMSAGNGFETEKEARDAVEVIKGILSSAKVTVEKADEKDK